jgi:rhamnogalacturonyl hydrolase YesR
MSQSSCECSTAPDRQASSNIAAELQRSFFQITMMRPNRLSLFLLTVFLLSGLRQRLAAAASVEATPASTARVIPLTDAAWAGSSVNVVANIRQALFTESVTQFAVFYDADGFMVLAKRRLGSDTWETRRSQYKGNVADAHNSISLVVDGAGSVHVSWDHHVSSLNYARSVAPGSLELGAKIPMIGEREGSVTYPQFFRLPDGDVLFLYRDGASGRGSLVLNRYTITTSRWTVVQPNLIDGEGKRSPYWDMAVDNNGGLHLAWNWRESPDVASNHDLCYARSTDGGKTWVCSDGSSLKLPITEATAEYAARIPAGSNLMNSPSIVADNLGRPLITSYWSPSAGAPPQFQIVRNDGKSWQTLAGPHRTDAFSLAGTGTKRLPISRATLLSEQAGRSFTYHLIYRDDARGGRIVAATMVDTAPNDWTERELTQGSVGAWEPSIDPILWGRLGQVDLLVQNVEQRDGDDRKAAVNTSTPIGVMIWSPGALRRAAMQHTSDAAPAEVDLNRVPIKAEMLTLLRKTADWQLTHMPDAERYPPRGWEVAPFYIGALALDSISPDRHFRDAMVAQGKANEWQPHRRIYHADDHCVCQAYLELYRQLGAKEMIGPTRARFDEILAKPPTSLMDWNSPHALDRWTWCDALFMDPVAWLQLWKVTGDARYLDYMNREWWITTERLFSPAVGFYFRDESYLDVREANGRTVHWARGNGWAFAGLCRVLDLFPKDHPDYPRYKKLYLDMAASVLAAQQADGLWRVGLLDPVAHPARETSGSSFMTFGLAWGVNRGLLERSRVEPVVRRAWNALAACVTPEGKLEHVQPIGAAPHGFDLHNTEPFAVGAFLLAGSEVCQLVKP